MYQGPSVMAEVKALLQSRVGDLVRELAPDGRQHLGYWIARCPWRDDKHAGSFYVWLGSLGKTPGAWRDDATGEKGDIVDLICKARNLDRRQALSWARRWLNYETLPAPARKAELEAYARRRAEREREAADELEQNKRRAFAVFVRSKQVNFISTLAHTYLLSRSIDVTLLPRMPGCLGFLPASRHPESGQEWPAMVAGFSRDDGRIEAVHRTFLARDGSGKAPIEPVRKIWPSFKGLAVRLWRGESGLSVKEACKHGLLETLAIVEGVEDGLSVAMARPDLRVWCAGSLANIGELEIPHCCDRVIVCADNDWGKPQAERLLNAGLQRLARQGRQVLVARSPVGKDMNDAIRG